MIRWCQYLVAILALSAIVGCSGQRESGKNKDLDRPKPVEKGGQ
jgi:hypothetical protein